MPLDNNDFFPRVIEAVRRLQEAHLPTLFLGLGLVALIVLLRRFAPKVPAAIVVCVVAVAVSLAFHLEARQIAVVGRLPAGLPGWALPRADWREIHNLLPAAIGIAFLAYTEGILLARSFAAKNGYEIAPNQELAALGAANLCNGFFQGFPVTGSQSRTTINDGAGGKTQMASLVMAACVALFMLYLTPILAHLPEAALAAILLYGGWTLVEFQAMQRIYRHYRGAAAIAAMTTLGVLVAGVVAGILLGVVLSADPHQPDFTPCRCRLARSARTRFPRRGRGGGARRCRVCWCTVFTPRFCSPIAPISPSASTAWWPPLPLRCAGWCWTPKPSRTLT